MKIWALGALLLTLAVSAPAQDASSLVGTWTTKVDLGRSLRGPLTVRRVGSEWTASIGPSRTAFAPRGDSVRFSFGVNGEFRGRLEQGSIHGFWIQPRGSDDPTDPASEILPFATPLILGPDGPSSWRGTVVPLDETFTLWLSIFRTPQGELMAAFRNPEFNSSGGASRFNITRKGDAIRFSMTNANGREITHDGALLRRPERIRIEWRDLRRTLELKRANGTAASFFPSPPGNASYIYSPPLQLDDGWRTARASEVGIDETAFQKIVSNIASSDPTARPPQLMHSVLVAHRGRLVLEEYFYGFDRSIPHDMRSAGKTFGSVLLGTKPARDAKLSPDSRIYDVLRAGGPYANPDARKPNIRLAHLLTHTSGLTCNDNDDQSPGNEQTMQSQTAQPDWWRYTLDLPMAHDPGTR